MHPELDRAKLKEVKAKEELQSKEELQPKEESQQRSWWKYIKGTVIKLINRISSSDKDESKRLPIVKTYLSQYYEFITGKSDLNLSPVEVFDEIMYIVVSLLQNSFYNNGSHHCLLYSDIRQVRN